jgi:CIC family chloride channel protein
VRRSSASWPESPLDGLDTSLFVVIGVSAFLGAGYRVPLAAVMFVAEATGRPGFVVPGLLAAVAAELVMGRFSVTTYQMTEESEAQGV